MKVDILTLFPDTVASVLHESILGRACKKGILEINCVQIRDFTENRQMQVDDYPYGGGWGCILMAQPLKSCLDSVKRPNEDRCRVIYMSPQGKTFTQETAKRLKRDYDHLVLVCGHYEGVDERFIDECVDEEISIGDFVLTGGEIAAMAVTDAVCRLVPGVLADEQCYTGESHWDGLLEYPQYTRPEEWEGRKVPEILLNGDHEKVERWRRKQQIRRTLLKRPDMFEKLAFENKEDKKLLQEVKKDMDRPALSKPLSCRKATLSDASEILQIMADAKEYLKRHKVDQWQEKDYPSEKIVCADIDNQNTYVVCHGEEIAATFTLSDGDEPDYDSIADGKWTPDISWCTLHRIAVAKKYRGTEISRYTLHCVEDVAAAFGWRAIRTDTHKNNRSMKTLIMDEGYRYRGNIIRPEVEEGHNRSFQAFEKVMKISRKKDL